jgi:putative phosphoribosyl transferase
VLALPRGGVPIGYEIAKALDAELDVFFVRKIGVPAFPELAMGAISSGGLVHVNQNMVREFGLSQEEVAGAIAAGEQELARQEALYREGRSPLDLNGKIAILVDDGIATGQTMNVAVEAAKKLGAKHVVIAAGAAPASTCQELRTEVDGMVCLVTARDFRAVGLFYEDFSQVSDKEVQRLLRCGKGDFPSPPT